MRIKGHTNITRVQYVQSDEIFAYTKDKNDTQIYIRVNLDSDFYNALKPLLVPESEIHLLVPSHTDEVALNLAKGKLEIIPKDTMVTTFPNAILYLTEPEKEK